MKLIDNLHFINSIRQFSLYVFRYYPSALSSPTRAPSLGEGDNVEANCKWYPGKIVRCRGDGTYDIKYDDVGSENKVSSDMIRAKDAPSSTKKDSRLPMPAKLNKRDKVEADYQGRGKSFSDTLELFLPEYGNERLSVF